MHRIMRKLRSLKNRYYSAHIIYLNEYLDAFPRENSGDKIGDMEFNSIFLNIIQMDVARNHMYRVLTEKSLQKICEYV